MVACIPESFNFSPPGKWVDCIEKSLKWLPDMKLPSTCEKLQNIKQGVHWGWLVADGAGVDLSPNQLCRQNILKLLKDDRKNLPCSLCEALRIPVIALRILPASKITKYVRRASSYLLKNESLFTEKNLSKGVLQLECLDW
jgi:hypothetical protein